MHGNISTKLNSFGKFMPSTEVEYAIHSGLDNKSIGDNSCVNGPGNQYYSYIYGLCKIPQCLFQHNNTISKHCQREWWRWLYSCDACAIASFIQLSFSFVVRVFLFLFVFSFRVLLTNSTNMHRLEIDQMMQIMHDAYDFRHIFNQIIHFSWISIVT